MHYLLVKHRVTDFATWKRIFDRDAEAQRQAGLHRLHLLRDTADRNLVVLLFRADDVEKARAFIEAPSAGESASAAGVVGVPEVLLLSE